MTITDYQSVMLPLLRLAADDQEHSLRRTIEILADEFGLTKNERKELLPSGHQATFDNRVGWARTYMKKAGLLESPRRGYLRITRRGHELLQSDPPTVNVKVLEQYPEFRQFRTRSPNRGVKSQQAVPEGTAEQTPVEMIETAHETIREELATEVLERVMKCSPAFFERLVVDLLVNMGYGGTRRDAGRAIGGSGDEGIDGIINEDRLGLEVVYIQAKRWKDTVSRPELQKFVGALQGQNARKGVFITTSSYSAGAKEYARMLQNRVILVDGEMLANLMIESNVGVSLEKAYEVKRVDSDYFDEV